jgi:CRP/FNR family cyclic AMP-dependent transcriptional regulator
VESARHGNPGTPHTHSRPATVVVVSMLDHCYQLPELTFAPGTSVIKQGESAWTLFVLVQGIVVVERDAVAVARIDTPGAVFGEMSVLLESPATATVRCETEVSMRVADDPLQFMTVQPEVALELARVLAGRVDSLTQYLVDVKQQYADLDGHLGMLDTVLGALTFQQRPRSRPGSVRDPDS